MKEEYDTLTSMGTWEPTTLPPGRYPITCKWVFKRKLTADGQRVERYRARLVIHGCRQRPGIDYQAVFAPVVRASTIRLFFSIVAAQDLECHSVDIKNAFIQSDLEDEIYISQPPGFQDSTCSVFRLRKSLYGLKQAPRVWNQALSKFLRTLGACQSQSDGSFFVISRHRAMVLVLLYVDDILIASRSMHNITAIKQQLFAKYKARDLGEVTTFLQMAVHRDRSRRLIVLRQKRHIDQLAQDAGLQDANPAPVPMLPDVYSDDDGAKIVSSAAITQYKSYLGVLMYIMNMTRPDIGFSVNYLARFSTHPSTCHFARLKDIIKYVKGTSHYGLFLGGVEKCPLYAYRF